MNDAADNVRPLAVAHGRVPPQDLDAERSLLGGILLSNDLLDDVVGIVRATDFYREAHRKTFEAILELSGRGEPIDRVTVTNELGRLGALEHVGGKDFVEVLDRITPSSSNLPYYARIVHEKAQARRLIESAHWIAATGYEQHGEVSELLDESESRIFAIREGDRAKSVSLRSELTPAFKRIESRYEHQGEVTGVPSGLVLLDRKTAGWQPGDLITVGARPSMGKTSFGLDNMREACRAVESGGLVVSLEMPKEQLVDRLLTQEGRINGQHLRTGFVAESEWPKLGAAAGRLAEMEIQILDDSNATVLDVRAEARRHAKALRAKGKKLRLILVDYVQLLRPSRERGDNRVQEIADDTRALKALAKELDCPVMILSQLNRKVEERNDKRPGLADLRESGSIEQDSDVVAFLYRDEVYNRESGEHGIAEIILAKQRNGPIGTCKVQWSEESTTFSNLAADVEPPAQGELLR